MAASLTTTRVDLFPNGTSVGAYLRSNWTKAERDKGPTGAPVGSAAGTATMTNGAATISGLAYDTDYYLVGQVGGVYVYVRGHTERASAAGASVVDSNIVGLYAKLGQSAYFRESIASGLVGLGSQTLLSSSHPTLIAVPFLAGEVVTNLDFASGSVAANTPTNQWAGICNAARSILATTVDKTTEAWAANAIKRFTFASPFVIPADGYYAVLLNVVATTVPNLAGYSGMGVLDAIQPVPSGIATGSTYTTPPAAGTVVVAPTSSTGVKAWVGVS